MRDLCQRVYPARHGPGAAFGRGAGVSGALRARLARGPAPMLRDGQPDGYAVADAW
jgi:hypothetical protein